jgi:hypothetical protein
LEKLSPANKTAIWDTCCLIPGFKNFNRTSFKKTLNLWATNILPNMVSITVLFGAVGFLKHHDVLKNEFLFPNTTTPVFRAFISSDIPGAKMAAAPKCTKEDFIKFHRASTDQRFSLEQFALHQQSELLEQFNAKYRAPAPERGGMPLSWRSSSAPSKEEAYSDNNSNNSNSNNSSNNRAASPPSDPPFPRQLPSPSESALHMLAFSALAAAAATDSPSPPLLKRKLPPPTPSAAAANWGEFKLFFGASGNSVPLPLAHSSLPLPPLDEPDGSDQPSPPKRSRKMDVASLLS